MVPLFHRQKALHILQNKPPGRMVSKNPHDFLEESAPRVSNALLLAGTAERLARKTSGEEIVPRDASAKFPDVPLLERVRAKNVPIDGATERIYIISPHGLDAQALTRKAETTYATEEFHRFKRSSRVHLRSFDRHLIICRRTIDRILLAALSGASCSQIRTTVHPAPRSSASCFRSRFTLANIFLLHHSLFVLGQLACLGHACQKQPSTKTTTRALVNTMSGLAKHPVTGRTWTR